jgi:hypothetical protein
MSQHSNKKREAPTSSAKAKVRGNNPLYKTAVQKAGSAHAKITNGGHYKANK